MHKKLLLFLVVLLSLVYVASAGVLGCQAWQGNNLILVDCNTLGPSTVCTDGGGNPIYKSGLPVLCSGGARDIPPPPPKPKPIIKPIVPDDPVDPIVSGGGKKAVACDYSCTEWTPEVCRGGYQERSCRCDCATCAGDNANRKLCPISENGYPNLPQTGSYLYAEPEGIFTRGEYHADFVNFYLGETGGEIYLISDGGQHIQGIGLHVGEPDAFMEINTVLPSWIKEYNEITDYTLRVVGDVATTKVEETATGFKVQFGVNQYMPVGQDSFSLELAKGSAVQTIPLFADIQPAKKSYLRTPKKEEKPSAFAGLFILSVILSFIIGGLSSLLLRRFIKKGTWGKTSFIFSILSIFLLGEPIFGLAFGLIGVKFSRNQKKVGKTKLATLSFLIGLFGIFLNFVILLGMS